MFPGRQVEPVAEGEGQMGNELPSLQPQAGSQHVFKHAIISGGILHVVHNLSWKMDSCLSGFKQYLDSLKAVVCLLHEKFHREVFIEKCVKGTPFDHARNGLQRAIPTTTEWRWNSVIDVLDALMPLRTLLRATFSVAKMRLGQDERPDDDASQKTKSGLIC
jgi:hypothetical protein